MTISIEKLEKERVLTLAALLETGAKYKTNENGHMYLLLTEEQQTEIEDDYYTDCKFEKYIRDLDELVEGLISNPGSTRIDIYENVWSGEKYLAERYKIIIKPSKFRTITGKQQWDRDKQKADGIIWNFGEDEASGYCKPAFKLKIYDIICKADGNSIVLNYGNTNPTNVKSYFKSLIE